MKSLIMLMIGVAILVLHIFLSKRDNKLLGLIVPIINILFSLNAVLAVAVYNEITNNNVIIQCIVVFIIYNIYTLILLGIYWSCRKKLNKSKEIDKMNIQDLN